VDSDEESSPTGEASDKFVVASTEMVYTLWITYSRYLHTSRTAQGESSPMVSGTATPLH
jgi:protein-serine/threonine kinase